MNNFHIKSPRQQRAVAALLERAISVKDLGLKIGALNPRQTILELRRQGGDDIIITERFTTTDQDGNLCRPGRYFIREDARPIVEKALAEYVSKTSAKCIGKAEKNRTNDNIRGA